MPKDDDDEASDDQLMTAHWLSGILASFLETGLSATEEAERFVAAGAAAVEANDQVGVEGNDELDSKIEFEEFEAQVDIHGEQSTPFQHYVTGFANFPPCYAHSHLIDQIVVAALLGSATATN